MCDTGQPWTQQVWSGGGSAGPGGGASRLVAVEVEGLADLDVVPFEAGGGVRRTGAVGDAGHHLEGGEGGGGVDHGRHTGGRRQLVPNPVEVGAALGSGVDEADEELGMRDVTVVVGEILAAVGDERQVDLGAAGEAARTEQAGVGGGSIEAFP